MKRNTSKRILSLLISVVMVLGIFATAIPAVADGAAYVWSVGQLRSNLQNPDITDVYLYTIDDYTPWIPITDSEHEVFIHVVGEKNLHLMGDATIRVPENPNEDYIKWSSLILVPEGASLTVDGDGCLNFHARWKNCVNAVILNEGDLVIHDADLAGFYSEQETAACAIWHYGGNMTINDGKFYGLNNDPDIDHWGAVRVCAPATIKGGYFRSAAGEKTSYGLMIPSLSTGDVIITGGSFRNIYLPTEDSVMADYVPNRYTTMRDGYWFNKDAPYSREYLAGGTIKVVNWIKEINFDIQKPVEGQPLDYNPVIYTEGYYLTTPVWIKDGNALDETKGPTAVAGASYKLKVWAVARDTDSYEFATPGNLNAYINGKAATISETNIFNREDVVILELDFGVCQNLVSEAFLSVTGPKELEKVRFAASVTNTDNCTVLSNVRWYENGTELFSGACFKAGSSYSVTIQIKAKDGCEFPVDEMGNPSVYCRVNGYDAEVFGVAGKDPAQYAAVRFDFGECNASVVETVTVENVTIPVAGEKPTYSCSIRGSGYSLRTDYTRYEDDYMPWGVPEEERKYYIVNGIGWADVTNDGFDWVYSDETFIPGHEYKVIVYLKTEDGFEFSHDKWYDILISATINGKTAGFKNGHSDYAWYQEISYAFPVAPADITSVTVTGLETPVEGAAPDYTAEVDNPYLYELGYDSGYNYSGIWWYDEDGYYVVPGHHVFEAGQTYRVQMYVAAAKLETGEPVGQFVEDVSVKLEGFVVDRVRVWDEVIIIDSYYTCPASLLSNTITGSITTSGDAESVSIQLIGEGESDPFIEAYGREDFSLSGIPNGRYTMVVSKKNHVTRTYDINMEDGKVELDIKLHLIGDIDGNGRINVGDAGKVYSHMKKKALITDEYMLLCADVSGDGRINVGDVGRIYSHIKSASLLW